jgi:hypothetical protein
MAEWADLIAVNAGQFAEEAPGEDKCALSIATLQTWLDEIRNQPNWRVTADRESEYYDGNQLDRETLAIMEERGIPPLITNLIKPTVDVVLGMEARTRTDWKVRPEAGDASDDVAEALSEKLHQAEITTKADRAISDAYASQVKVGIGWVEIARNVDPFLPDYRVQAVNRREMFWDWRARQPDLSDARYFVRKKWMDVDVLKTAFPDKADTLENCVNSWQNWDIWYANDTMMARAYDQERGFTVETYEWVNPARRRIVTYEAWYKVMTSGPVIRTANGATEVFNPKNPIHAEEVRGGNLPQQANYMAVRVAIYAGPHLLNDMPSPYRHQHFPYVPFFGFREDRTGVPYGLIRSMISPQDAFNARKSNIYWRLTTLRVIADSDAVLDHQKTAEEVARKDAYIVLNANRKPSSNFTIDKGESITSQEFEMLQADAKEINQAAGVYQAMMGSDNNAKSGLAINSLVEQGTTTLGELNDNAVHSRRMVGELLAELVKEDLERQLNVTVTIDQGRQEKTIVLNQPARNRQTGEFMLQNNVAAVRCSVVLDDVPQTPTYRNQQLSQLADLVKSLPPQLQAPLMPFVLESTDLSNRFEMADVLRKVLGLRGGDGEGNAPDSEKEQLKQMVAQLQQQLQQATTAPQLEELKARISKIEADKALQHMKALKIVDELAKSKHASQAEEQAEALAGLPNNSSEEKHEY